MNWFNKEDINIKAHNLIHNSLSKNNIKGFVLPHAGTTFTGHILSHTLRFIPKNFFDSILILYYPANKEENIMISHKEKYFHEYYVLFKTLDYVSQHIWKYGKKKIQGINVRDINKNIHYNTFPIISKKTLLIISADFSHFLPLKNAIKKENCAAHALMHRYFSKYLECLNVVDIKNSFELMYKVIPPDWYLQWIGRTRSPGKQGVGYLSFLIKQPQKKFRKPDGMFITAYDVNMQQRECLGEWFYKSNIYNKLIENNLLQKVINYAQKTSRLTNGRGLDIPVTHYTITYLYRDNESNFIRGYHGIKGSAFYLPDVMLENTYNNGQWITPDDQFWPKSNKFKMRQTLHKIREKANSFTRKFKSKFYKNNNTRYIKHNFVQNDYELFYSDVVHKKL